MGCLGSLVSLVVRALDSCLDSREFDSRPPKLLLGLVAVFGQSNHHSILPNLGQLSLLLSEGWKMSTRQSAVKHCGLGLKVSRQVWFIALVDKCVGGR